MHELSRAFRPLLRRASLAVLAMSLGCSSSGGGGSATEDGRLRVVATTGMIGDIVAAIAGPHARVETLMGPGVDPHLYKATESDLTRLGEAQVIFYNGLHLEGKMADILGKLGKQKTVVAVAERIPESSLLSPPGYEGAHDPHVWFDVSLWSHAVDAVVDGLSAAAREHAQSFHEEGVRLQQRLKTLDTWVAEQIAQIPPERRVLVTAHDAFGYFGRRYDIEVVGLQGISTASQAGIQDIERIVKLLVERQVKAVFVETSVPRRNIEAVIEACVSRGHEVTIGGELFSDAMGAAGTREGTYVGMVEHNVKTIVGALK